MYCACVAPRMLEELRKQIQHRCVTLRRSRNKRNVGSCWLKRLTSSRRWRKASSGRAGQALPQRVTIQSINKRFKRSVETKIYNIFSQMNSGNSRKLSREKSMKFPRPTGNLEFEIFSLPSTLSFVCDFPSSQKDLLREN